MKITAIALVGVAILSLSSCRQEIDQAITNYQYFDLVETDTLEKSILVAVTDEEFLEYGSRVAYVNLKGDTIIPLGKYAYYGTDSLIHYANVIEYPNDSTFGRQIAINRDQKVLFDLVMFDNGPEPFVEGLTRVSRNGKMGYANETGKVVIPCIYDYAKQFYQGKAEVTFEAVEYMDGDEHRRVESEEWFEIDRKGNKIKNAP
ncbi:WG repeat-containing protein [Rhodocytophaga aerolata]|uniref:WG repeat-containing protein n=1 Tax=Rhodocytophaga aerolata TaxID=455078 RepID=A0ABT8RIP3_9BACT|nr:WG repeat-containing protein [Rhodocytophaga aerolata]MDO1451955.1 WG repeat-containing protein [Rhodocytophaga aerolata]